jgi:RNAse (barnase) inhibitor barstar
MALIDKPERARQLARAIASDLDLYHQAKITDGLEKDTLWDVMRSEVEEGRALFKSRVTPEIYAMNHYDRALVDVILKTKGQIKSRIW